VLSDAGPGSELCLRLVDEVPESSDKFGKQLGMRTIIEAGDSVEELGLAELGAEDITDSPFLGRSWCLRQPVHEEGEVLTFDDLNRVEVGSRRLDGSVDDRQRVVDRAQFRARTADDRKVERI